jgi:hypothetical protein
MAPERLFVTLATAMLLGSCATPIHIDGVLVTGERQDVSESDVRAATAAMRADLPQIRSQQLTRIEVIDSNKVFLSYREEGERFSTPYVVKRVNGHWHYTGEIVMGSAD